MPMKHATPFFIISLLFATLFACTEKTGTVIDDPSTQTKTTPLTTSVAYITNWLVIGEFPSVTAATQENGRPDVHRDNFDNDYLTEHGGETSIRPTLGMKHTLADGTTRAWQAYQSLKDEVGMRLKLFLMTNNRPTDHCVLYLYQTVVSPVERDVVFVGGVDDGAKVYVNDELVFSVFRRGDAHKDDHVYSVHLKKGTNHILAKVEQGGGGTSFFLGIADAFATFSYAPSGMPLYTVMFPNAYMGKEVAIFLPAGDEKARGNADDDEAPLHVGGNKLLTKATLTNMGHTAGCRIPLVINDEVAATDEVTSRIAAKNVSTATPFGMYARWISFYATIDKNIARNRMGTIVIKGTPGAKVRVTQKKHEYHFGTALATKLGMDYETFIAFREARYKARGMEMPPQPTKEEYESDMAKYKAILTSSFNAAVHENALKWPQCEREQGEVDYSVPDAIYNFCASNDIQMRGHCLFWASKRAIPGWAKELSDDALRDAIHRRAEDVTAHYKGRITEFDLNNEMLHHSTFRKRLGDGIVKEMAEYALKGNPDAILYVNDFNVLLGTNKANAYVAQIKRLLADGVPVKGIGLQSHFWGKAGIDPTEVVYALDTLAKLNLPIKATELDLAAHTEEEHAAYVRLFYRIFFAHPATVGIINWGFTDALHWRGKEGGGLWDKNYNPKLAAKEHLRLTQQEWWTRFEGTIGKDGTLSLPAYFGTHTVSVGDEIKEVVLPKRAGSANITF